MLLVTLGVAFGSVVFGPSIILLLSGHEYIGAADVLPLILLGVGLRETAHISAATFYVRRDTRRLLIVRVCVSVLAITANLLGALSAGLMGVAIASAMSGAVYLLALAWVDRQARGRPAR